MTNTGRAVMATLRNYGIDSIFGIPGNTTSSSTGRCPNWASEL
jgi:thiamine pyrophosphate-dependent acetolactate synthase large subunit-like protein